MDETIILSGLFGLWIFGIGSR